MEILDGTDAFLQWDRTLSELSEPESECVLYNTHFSELLDDLSQDALLGQLLSDPFLSGRSNDPDGEDEEELSPASPAPPHIQAEHSYSLSGDSRPQSPLLHLTDEPGSEAGEPGEHANSEPEDWPMEVEEEDEEENELLKMETSALLPTVELSLAPEGPPMSPPTSSSLPALPSCSTQVKTMKVKNTEVKEHGEASSPKIKLEPHEVDQFLNLSPKELDTLQLPPTPPSSHGSDSEGSLSPVRQCAPSSPAPPPPQASSKASSRATSSLSNSPLLTAPHKLQGSGPLLLTEEERRTLIAEGYPVPTKLPLSKSEEKALKKIRRKIKNKISAQESRRKKKEYMDALEKKVETCSNENSELRRKVETLENTNKSLIQQLHSLQAVVAGKVPRSCRVTSTQTSTCLMVVVLCFAIFLGSFYQGLELCSSITQSGLPLDLTVQESYTAKVKSRSLLGYEEHGALEDTYPSGLAGEYPEQWDTPPTVMATWRAQQQRQAEEAERRSQADPHLPAVHSNETDAQKPILIDLHQHRVLERWVNESMNIIQLERNETS